MLSPRRHPPGDLPVQVFEGRLRLGQAEELPRVIRRSSIAMPNLPRVLPTGVWPTRRYAGQDARAPRTRC